MKLLSTQGEYFSAIRDFFQLASSDRVTLLRTGLNSLERVDVIPLLPNLKQDDLKGIFDELIHLASFSHGSIERIREAIRALPHEWIVQNIEQSVDRWLVDGNGDTYGHILGLLAEYDQPLVRKYANAAMHHEDPDVRDVALDFLNNVLSDEARG